MPPPQGHYEGLETAHYHGIEVSDHGRAHEGIELAPHHGIEVSGDSSAMELGHYPYQHMPEPTTTASDKEMFTADTEVQEYDDDSRSQLRRALKTRQIAMIALGGALGTGLLINTGQSLNNGGPASMIIAYSLVGWLCFTVMSAMGEMAAWLPLPSGFTGFAHRFVDPALGFALGWNYWFKYIITTPNNILACVLILDLWYKGPTGYNAFFVVIILAAIIAINYFGVGIFGELEFWLSSIKIVILIGLIIFTLYITITGGRHPPGVRAKGFYYWHRAGAFARFQPTGANAPIAGSTGYFLGFFSVLKDATFSFLGTELVGVTSGEAQNPRKAIPRAVKLTFFRIVFFYLILVLLLGMTVPYNSTILIDSNNEATKSLTADASPFVAAAKIAGIGAVANLLNLCLLIFAFSAANSDLYIATRTLYSLAIERNAPRIFARTNKRGVPIYALALSSACCSIAFISVKKGVFTTFTYFVSLVTVFGILSWISILVTHIYFVRARRAQNIPNSALAFVSPFGVLGSQIALGFAAIITIFGGFAVFLHNEKKGKPWDPANFVAYYLPLPIYVLLIVGYKVIMKTRTPRPEHVDLYGGKAQIDKEEAEFLAEEAKLKGGVRERGYMRLYRVTLGNFF